MQAVLEVALGLGFVYLLFSTMTSTIVEWISALLERRAATLHDGLETALGPELTNDLLNHPAIAGIRPSAQRRPPAYLAPKAVSLALIDIARQAPAMARDRDDADARSRLRGLMRALTTEPQQDEAALVTDPEVVLHRVERWFTEQMDRTSGSYKRWTQVWMIAVAATLTLAFDLDTGRIAGELHRNAAVRSALATEASAAVVNKAFDDFNGSLTRLDTLPVGWTRMRTAAPGFRDVKTIGIAILGWAITIVALGLGAPFWFDVVNRIVSVRQTAPRPPDRDTFVAQ